VKHPGLPGRVWDVTVRADGSLVLGPEALKDAGLAPGMKVRLQIADALLHKDLRRRGVTGREVSAIAAAQMATGESVIRCLRAEGKLASSRTFGKKRRR
jgi:hypothetical protein